MTEINFLSILHMVALQCSLWALNSNLLDKPANPKEKTGEEILAASGGEVHKDLMGRSSSVEDIPP